MAKAPIAGRVKSRLGAEIGVGRATALFRFMTKLTASRMTAGAWRATIAVDPATAIEGFDNVWPPDVQRLPQAKGDLGARMAAAMNSAPPGPVIVIGVDAPGITSLHLRRAFDALRGADAVFGPAEDGGYWLVGFARRRPVGQLPSGLFKDVRWSTEHALDDTIASLPKSFRIARLETLGDVDVAADLVHLRRFAVQY